MRFGRSVGEAALTLLGGGLLTVGVLGSAQAAALMPQGQGAASADIVCQALPSSASPSPSPTSSSSPSPTNSPTPSPTNSPTPSPTGSPSPTQSPPSATAPSAPQGLTAAAGDGQVTLSWTAPSSDGGSPVTGYDIYRSTTSGDPAPVGTATGTTYTDTGLVNGTTYYYTVAAVNAVGTSPQSGEASATPQGRASPSPSGSSASATTTAASLDALIAPASPVAPAELCVSVQAAQSSITRGKTATYTVQVSTESGSASDVSVALASQPSSQRPEFTSGCTRGDGTASCTVASVTTAKPVSLNAQIAVASSATSVTSVKLTATASIASTVNWTPPAAAASTSVTSAAVTHSSAKASHSQATASQAAVPLPALSLGSISLGSISLGPIPNLNVESSLLFGAGDAAQLFPAITPAAVPTASPVVDPRVGRQNAEPAADSSAVAPGTADFTAQMAGLVVLGLGIMLTVARRSLRKRSGSRRSNS